MAEIDLKWPIEGYPQFDTKSPIRQTQP